ncbi:multiple epidermal growth factor-like domains protein 10 isoform X2 [Ostrea edulis]|uniref:multiple epidermal growth factor-like domains protein 10 isoform X2 n=1 Tax=Ostrea edulis TaxID=37623 RepID=UPI0024AFC933|nr:multiple epidermal growth factor-like domains protein 10 isoform X2 [Ostrea edulis]
MKFGIFCVFFIQIGNFIYVQSYDQLVTPGVTEAVSSSVGWGGYPNKTVDGDKTQNPYTYCMHTAGGKTEAWLRVDLGGIYNLRSVKIWYKNDRPPENTKRLQGFSIRLSNTPTPVPSDTCYQDPGDQTLPAVLERDCRGAAQYVWFYTNRDNGGGVFLEICEVEVYGCPEKHYGEECGICNDCEKHCDVINGQCRCFKAEHHPPTCNRECKHGFYGTNCSLVCGHCAGNATCDHVTGSCPSGHCAPGWKHTSDRKCDQECDDGWYGLYCNESCSDHCLGGPSCRKTDGVCLGGCSDGWTNPQCNIACKEGFYGPNCSHICGHCAGNATCDHVTGSCPSMECEPGWKHTSDRKCDQECQEGFYGRDCGFHCGNCAGKGRCDHVNGSCPSPYCEPGWKHTDDWRCDQECDDGTFGYNCMVTCRGHCADGLPCRKRDGVCPGGCMNGWTNSHCSGKCSHGSYGKACMERCGYCADNEPCNHINGTCPGSCEPGYQGKKCDIEKDTGTSGSLCHSMCTIVQNRT